MSNIKALRQRKIDGTNKQRALLDLAAKEARELNETEAAQYDDGIKALESLEKQIIREEQVLQLEKGGPVVDADDPNPNPAAAREVVDDPKKKFSGLGQFLQAVVQAERSHGRNIDSRLMATASGQSEAVPSDGGFLVQNDIATEILKNSHDVGAISSRVRHVPVSGPGLKINAVDETSRATGSRWGGVRAYWVNEADTVAASKVKFRQMNLTLNKLMAIYYMTDELMQDAPAMDAILKEAFAEEMNFVLEDAIIEGDGSGKPLGIMNSPALITVSKEGSQPATTLFAENIIKMNSRLTPRSQANAVWLVNADVTAQLPGMNLKIKNVAGTENVGGIATPIYQYPNGNFGNGNYGTLLGKPVIPVDYLSTLGTLGDILLVDLSQYILIEKALESASSMHVRFLNEEMAFRISWRVEGQPIWNSALTPFKGSTSTSPYVTLQAR